MAGIVVSGFGPWGAIDENPTLAVLALLRATPDLAGHLTTLDLPVDSARMTAMIADTLDAVRPALWIGLGLAFGSAVIAVERIAVNVMDFGECDSAGVRHGGEPAVRDGPAAYVATIPVKAVAARLRAAGIPAHVSNTAGTFLCNQMMYTLLHQAAARGGATRAGFLHVPAHPALVARQSGRAAEHPSMDVALMTAAVLVTIATLTEPR